MENKEIIEKMKIEIGDSFLEEGDVLTLGHAIALIKIMKDDK